MREMIVIVILVAISHPIAGIVNAEKWELAEMNERFENAKRDLARAEGDLSMPPEWVLSDQTSRCYSE